jgi:hypothetical protein
MVACEYCGRWFNNRGNKWKHKKVCYHRPKEKIRIDIRPRVPVTNNNSLGQQEQRETPQDLKILIQEMHKFQKELLEQQKQQLEFMKLQKEQMDRQMLPQRPITVTNYNNNVTNNFNGISQIGPDVFKSLIEKFGKDKAISMLTSKDLTGTVINVIKRLYFDGVQPNEFPIACKPGNHFRYLDDNRNLIDDFGGKKTQQFVTTKVNDAMIQAVNDIIFKCMDNNGDGTVDFDLRRLQNNLEPTSARSTEITEALVELALNIHHPFFSQLTGFKKVPVPIRPRLNNKSP